MDKSSPYHTCRLPSLLLLSPFCAPAVCNVSNGPPSLGHVCIHLTHERLPLPSHLQLSGYNFSRFRPAFSRLSIHLHLLYRLFRSSLPMPFLRVIRDTRPGCSPLLFQKLLIANIFSPLEAVQFSHLCLHPFMMKYETSYTLFVNTKSVRG